MLNDPLISTFFYLEMLQRVLEKPLEKKAGRNYGPQGNKRLIYFIDGKSKSELLQHI